MEGLQSCGAACGCAFYPPDIQFQQQSTRLNSLRISEDQSSEITIVTDEGDMVMITGRQSANVDLLTYENLSFSHQRQNREEIQWAEFTAESELTFAVQGDLNDQEMADIQTLLKDLAGMLKAFLTGGDERDPSREVANDLDRFETISAFRADFEFCASMQYLNFEADELSLRMAAEAEQQPLEESGPAGVAAAASSPAAAPASAATDQTAIPIKEHRCEAEHAAARMAKRVHDAGLSGFRRLKHLKKFLQTFLKEMLANQLMNPEQAKRGQSVIEKFMNGLQRPVDVVEVRGSRATLNLQYAGRAYGVTIQSALEPAIVESA